MTGSLAVIDTIIVLAVVLLETIAGLVNNVFIAFIISFHFLRGENLNSVNKILLALSISNICYSLASSSNVISSYLVPSLHRVIVFSMSAATMFCLTSSTWISSCLCLFYFIKITGFSSGLLALVKTRIDAITPWMIMVAEVISLFSCFLHITFFVASPNAVTVSVNSSSSAAPEIVITQMNMYVASVANLLPFLIVLGTTLSTICALTLHSHRMERGLGSAGTRPLRAHRRPITMMICLLLYYAFFWGVLYAFYFLQLNPLSAAYWFFVILMFSFPFVQSALLIFGNPRLMEAFKTFLHYF